VTTRKTGDTLSNGGTMLIVFVAPDAQMACPTPDLQWQLRYGDGQTARVTAASVVDSFEYLINHCDKDEAWRRIQIMRRAMRSQAST
jgi:hypothetical protein